MNLVRSRRRYTLLLLACVVALGIWSASSPSTASAALAPSVAAATPLATPLPPKTWTIMVYIDGDNDLEKYVTLDIERELCRPGSNADVNVVCVADRTPGYDRSRGDWTGTKLFYCTQGLTATPANAAADWGERDLGDPQTVIDFVGWAKTNYPAANYALIFWDHGYMWFRGQTMWDRTSKNALNQDELAAALQTCGPVGVIGWDCCNMQLVEAAATVRPYAQMMVGSEEYTNWEGLQYDKFVANLERYPGWTPEQLATNMAATARGDSLTFSAIALDARFDDLVAAVDRWAIALQGGLRANRRAYDAARRASGRFYYSDGERDLYAAACQIRARVKSPTIRASCTAVMDAVLADVTYNWFRSGRVDGLTYGRCHGLAIWWPKAGWQLNRPWSPGDDWAYYRAKLVFAAQTHWDEFLARYVR